MWSLDYHQLAYVESNTNFTLQTGEPVVDVDNEERGEDPGDGDEASSVRRKNVAEEILLQLNDESRQT